MTLSPSQRRLHLRKTVTYLGARTGLQAQSDLPVRGIAALAPSSLQRTAGHSWVGLRHHTRRRTSRNVGAVSRIGQERGTVDFAKGQRNDDVMQDRLARFTAQQGVVFIGRAQEKTRLFRTEKRRHADGVAYGWIVKSTGMVHHYYFYCVDPDFGLFFTNSVPISCTPQNCGQTHPPASPATNPAALARLKRLGLGHHSDCR